MYEKKPWLKHYEDHVSESLDYPDLTISEALEETARLHPDFISMIFKGRSISYAEMNDSVNLLTAAFQQLGLDPGDRVALHLPNCPQFPISYVAVLRAGGIMVPCNPLYTARELKHQLNDSGARIIITLSSLYSTISDIRSESGLEHVVVAKIKSYFPPILKLLFTVLRENKTGHRADISADDNTYWFQDLLSTRSDEPEPITLSDEDTAVLMYTGGTTGISKGAQLTHKNIVVNAWQALRWIDAGDEPEATLTTLPLFHSYGMSMCMNACLLSGGTMVLVPDPRDTADIVKTIDKHRPSYFPGVPAMYVAINNFAGIDRYDLSSIKSCASGAAPLPPEVQQRFQELTGARLAEGYGLSEASPATHGNPAFGDIRIGTIGLPWPDTEVKIVDHLLGEDPVPVGEVGELCIRGPQVMKGYWRMPVETANALRSSSEEGDPWLYTGDMATMDEDGYFRIAERKKDMILGAGGLNIYPREIEDVLYEHPKVLEAAAIGIDAGEKGERVKVFVVLREGMRASQEEILAHCEENMAPHKVPKIIEFRSKLPKTLVGKVLKRKLVEEELARQPPSA
jgi:long-chain acyl-CoA synthetase